MAILTFNAPAVAAQIAHARSCSRFKPEWNAEVQEPRLLLVVGLGVRLMSNGLDTVTQLHPQKGPNAEHAYALGMNPLRDPDWHHMQGPVFGEVEATYQTQILDDVQMQIDRGVDQIRISIDNHLIRVFSATQADYLIGAQYEVPSGLGGVFYVELLDINGVTATVQNLGNCEDFDEMPPYKVALDQLREIKQARAA